MDDRLPDDNDSNRISELRSHLVQHLQVISQERDPYFATAGYFFIRSYLQEQLSQWGTVAVETATIGQQTAQNIVLSLPGARSRPPIVIGAHYDAVVGSPGADDNASGVAVLLELARWFATNPPIHPVVLVAFDLEEYGLIGSRVMAEQWRSRRQPIRLMLSLEMLGYRDTNPESQRYPAGLERLYGDRGDFIALIGNLKTLPDLLTLSRHLKRSVRCEWLPAGLRGKWIPDTRRSDHAPFWDAGYRAMMVTDTANLRNPNYHQPTDTLETLDLDFLTAIAFGLADSIGRLR
jgi:Zn-dependent M28 family amino/carboxypeptidase